MKSFGTAKKVILIGLDGLMMEMVEKFAAEGILPNLKRLMRQGIINAILPSPPCDTPTNWTTIATGAWTGTHGNNGFCVHLPGETFERQHVFGPNIFPEYASIAETNLNEMSRAEYIWQAAQQQGKRCILVNWPGGWPPNMKDVITIDGSGPASSPLVRVGYPAIYSTKKKGGYHKLEVLPAIGWKHAPKSKLLARESAFLVTGGGIVKREGRSWVITDNNEKILSSKRDIWYLYIFSQDGRCYDTVYVFKSKHDTKPIVKLRQGRWTGVFKHETVQSIEQYGNLGTKKDRLIEILFRMKLLYLSDQGDDLCIYRTTLLNPHGWCSPQKLANILIKEELDKECARSNKDLFAPKIDHFTPQIMPLCQLYESVPSQAQAIASLSRRLAKSNKWDFLMVQIHAPDGLNHKHLNHICPGAWQYDRKKAKKVWDIFREEYSVLDQTVGEILKTARNKDTLTIVISDHAALPTWKQLWPGKALVEAGLLVYKEDNKAGLMRLDLKKSSAIMGQWPFAMNIWVNLKGRERHGIVNKQDKERIENVIIKALYSLRDPETGECPIALAIRKEDAFFLGQWGERIGDVIFYMNPAYDCDIHHGTGVSPLTFPIDMYKDIFKKRKWVKKVGHLGIHDNFLPDAHYKGCSVHGVCLMAGPGIKKGYRPHHPFWMVDLTPTIFYLLGIHPPRQSDGKIAFKLLKK